MANTFGILTALVLAFSAFVAFKNKEEYTNQITITENESKKRDRNTNNFEDLQDEIAEFNSEKDTANKSRDEFQGKLEEQETAVATVEKKASESKAALDETMASLNDKKKKLEELGPLKGLKPKIEQITISTQENEDKLAILNAQNARLRSDKTDSKARLDAIKKKLSDYTSGRSLPSMKTSIRSISSTLGFVTLSGGMTSGVVGGSKVAVMRGGEKIAELNVTAVSSNTATADVIQSTLKKGERVSVGDKVVAAEITEK